MKKYLIVSGIALTSVMFSLAETETAPLPVKKGEGEIKKVQMMQASMKENMMKDGILPAPLTGDVTKDAQIKALHEEMEKKIKALRDEYQTKIKAIVGDTKPMRATSSKMMMKKEEMMNATSSKPGMMRGEKNGVPFRDNTGMPGKREGQPEVRGTSTEAVKRGFFDRMFER
ncbi:MAG: hypothetical protein RI935_567 [Candidatus Parcubacteria bacterium]|jgi:hypothetical protein